MRGFEMITIIAVFAIMASIVRHWLSQKAVPEVDLSSIEARLDKLEALQERVEVLEAIVTDKGYDLKREIDNLS